MKNYVMKVLIGLIFSVILFTSFFSNLAEAESAVYIPDHEYVGFFDHDGIFTVIAGIKNQENFAVIPTLTVEVSDGNKIISSDYEFSSIMPQQMLPIKIKLPEVTNENPILEPPIITSPFASTTNFSAIAFVSEGSTINPSFPSVIRSGAIQYFVDITGRAQAIACGITKGPLSSNVGKQNTLHWL